MGKGGVGKTTIAAGLAVLDAEVDGRAVLVEFGDGESGRRALGGSHRLVEHVVIKSDEAIRRGATTLFGSAAIAKLALGNFAMRPLLRAAPAVRELAMLESVRQIAEERPGARVVVDMPATGHGVAWLRIPRQGRKLLASGPLFEMCDRVGRELLAPGFGSIIVVTLPERLVIEETLELCALIAEEGGIAVEHIVVNRMPVALPATAAEDAKTMAAQGGPHAKAAGALQEVLETREAARAEALEALQELALKRRAIWRVPLAPTDPSARDVARWLAAEGAS
jgi:anion-transporting  ArsA/GET3 family ATPase